MSALSGADAGPLEDSGAGSGDTTDSDSGALIRSLADLSERQRAAYVSVELNGYAPSDFAGGVGIAPSTARTHLQRARRTLAPVDPFRCPRLDREHAERILEGAASERYGIELISDEDGAEWFDGREPGGLPAEIKAAALRVPDGSSRRRGRWLIRWQNHRDLLRASGRYVLGVYDRRGEVIALANLSAARVDRLLEAASWFPCESSRRGGEAAQICYREVFPNLDQRIREEISR